MRPCCWTTNDPTAERLVPHPMQLEFRLSQDQFANKPGIAGGTYPKLWAAHETEGQLIVTGVSEEQSRRAMGGTYIQSPNLKLVFGLGGLLDSTNVPDSCCIGATRSGRGENLEGGGKEMTGEFISRENGGCGEWEESDCGGRTLGTMNNRLRANVYALAAALRV
jgi:hypothetical protein